MTGYTARQDAIATDRNLFGPIFVEIIQRVDNLGFGEGNLPGTV